MKKTAEGRGLSSYMKNLVILCSIIPSASQAASPVLPSTLVPPKVSQDMSTFLGAWNALDVIERKPHVTADDKKNAAIHVAKVKHDIPLLQQSMLSIVAGAKANGMWTPEFDSTVIGRISTMPIPPSAKTHLLKLIAMNGGPRQVLEIGARSVTAPEQDLNDTLHSIDNKRSSLELIGTAYAAERKWGFWKCVFVLGIGVAAGLGGQVGATYGAAVATAGNCL